MISFKNCAMANISDIQGVIFDYGGTLDSRGVHWSEVIRRGYELAGVRVEKGVFRDAYVYAERLLARCPLIRSEYTFHDLMTVKIYHELKYLCETGALPHAGVEILTQKIAGYCYDSARECVEEARPVLGKLKSRFPMVMVSNFYGNLTSVLKDFDLLKYFDSVVESAVVGVRKPDSAIFGMGVKKLGLQPENVVVIGDSYSKDIKPAALLGCKTIWLKGVGWGDEPENECDAVEVLKLAEVCDAIL